MICEGMAGASLMAQCRQAPAVAAIVRRRIAGITPPARSSSTSNCVSTAAVARSGCVVAVGAHDASPVPARAAGSARAAPRLDAVAGLRCAACAGPMPAGRRSGRMPMPIRFERWMRSKLAASTARTPEQALALGRPVARRAGAVALARDDHHRLARVAIALRRLPDRHDLAARARAACARPARPGASRLHERPAVERGAQHHLPVAAARREDVEVVAIVAALDEEVGDQAVRRDRARRRDVVGGDVVAEHQQRVGARSCRAASLSRREANGGRRRMVERGSQGKRGAAGRVERDASRGLRLAAAEVARGSRAGRARARGARRSPRPSGQRSRRHDRRAVGGRSAPARRAGRARRRRRARRRPPAAATS